MTPRKCVLEFAELMEQKLRENDHKGGWDECNAFDLNERIFDEARELYSVIGRFVEPEDIDEWSNEVGRESADVANFAMMIWDVSRK